MILKIVTLFLVFVAVLAVFGRLRLPWSGGATRKCPSCGRPRIGRGPCPCGGEGGRR